jgi:2-methylcitrate dehydratase PrpD
VPTIIQQLASFATDTSFEALPGPVIEESKRLILDSLGCALAGTDHPKGRIGIEYGRLMGQSGNATIIGTTDRVSIFGAAVANGELINALDMDAILPPGHVSPYVLPGSLNMGEALGCPGKDVIRSVAVAHEMSWRMGKAMDYLRDTKDGQLNTPPVFGYSSTILGATAAIGMLQRQSREVIAHSLGIAGCIAPTQPLIAFFMHAPGTTLKYQMAGALVQAAMLATHMGQLGHRGDIEVLDDGEYGFARFIGTRRWEPARITEELGKRWGFVTEQTYKPYPHCRCLHGPLDCLIDIVEKNDIRPEEIDGITAVVESYNLMPTWVTRDIQHVTDGQFSIAHGLAMGAHRLTPGKDWQDPKNVFSPSVLALMKKVTYDVHPDYVKALDTHGLARPTKVEVRARGQTFIAEKLYPKGSPSPDSGTLMTNDELVQKFRHNASSVLSPGAIDSVVNAVLEVETVSNFATVMRQVARSRFESSVPRSTSASSEPPVAVRSEGVTA